MRKRKEVRPKEGVSAKQKALDLLLYKTRTEQELYEKLLERGYGPEESAEAVAYAKYYGYVNDEDYAARYADVHGKEKGATAIRRELREKGVPEEYIEAALWDMPEEEETVRALLERKAGEAHRMEEKEFRRWVGFFLRRGFSSGAVIRSLKQYQEDAEDES